MSEGYDYSSTGHADWNALAAAMRAEKGNVGEIPVGRYVVNDKAPNGRGISAAEYAALAAAGFGVFAFWESTEGWMLDGFSSGVAAAQNAHANLLDAGMPARMPIMFACDIDASEGQQAAIDDCLRGCASVIGLERTGLYAGYYPLQRAMQNRTATWFVQTSAWSAGMILPGIHALQYEYNQWVGGTNMDLIRTFKDNYGQASQFIAEPFPASSLPDWWDEQLASNDPTDQTWDGNHWMVVNRNVSALSPTWPYTKPDVHSPRGGEQIKTRQKRRIVRVFDQTTTDDKGKKKTVTWLVGDDGRYYFGGRFSPRIQIRHR